MSDTHHLVLSHVDLQGARLGLRVGDRLVAVNGIAFNGSSSKLRERFMADRTRALTFDRDGIRITVLSSTDRLGRWQPENGALDTSGLVRIDPRYLRNWEIYRGDDGVYDALPTTRSLIALVAAPFWLLQMRLWHHVAAWGAMTIFACVAGLGVALAVQVLTGLFYWKFGLSILRQDRTERGLHLSMVLAAHSEPRVHAEVKLLDPALSWIYAPTSASEPAASTA